MSKLVAVGIESYSTFNRFDLLKTMMTLMTDRKFHAALLCNFVTKREIDRVINFVSLILIARNFVTV